MKNLTVKEMTDSQKLRVKTRLDQERKKLGRPLTNAEQNKIKKQMIAEISSEVEKVAKIAKAQKKKEQLTVSNETFSWSAKNHSRGLR